jgi:acetyl esterase/lipase
VVLQAASGSYYKGPLLSEDVKPGEVGATWYPAPISASSDLSNVTVILHIHGGAFVLGDGRTGATGSLASHLLKNTPATHVFMPQYRVSTLPASKNSNPFPAALQDSLSAYLYLVNTLKISPKNIIFSGDSAGGNAIIALLRYIVEYGADLNIPNPSAALLWSPWVDPASSLTGSFVKTNANYGTDYLPLEFTKWGCLAYAGLASEKILSSPYISHLGKPFKTEVPLFVNAGDAEVLYFDIEPFVKQMQKEGNDVTWDVQKNVPHDVLLVGDDLGFHKEAQEQAKRAGEWIKGLSK